MKRTVEVVMEVVMPVPVRFFVEIDDDTFEEDDVSNTTSIEDVEDGCKGVAVVDSVGVVTENMTADDFDQLDKLVLEAYKLDKEKNPSGG